MDKEFAGTVKTPRCPAVKRDCEDSGNTSQAASAKDGRPGRTKRKTCTKKKTQRNTTRTSKVAEPCSSFEVDSRLKREKRKDREDGEESLKTPKRIRRLDLTQSDKDTASTSVDTDREGCSTSVKDVSKKSIKRKAATDGEGPCSKKRRSLDLIETKNKTTEETKEDLSTDSQRDFQNKYQQENQLGEGGCGSVFAGYRRADNLPVAIKHISKDKVYCTAETKNGKQLSIEVVIMLKLSGEKAKRVGTSVPVSLLDWYDLGKELILVLERPIPSEDLFKYRERNGGFLEEEKAKIILKQLVDGAIELQNQHIFHRDIKIENILIETSSDVPRVRLIDFGLSCFFKKTSCYHVFYGTTAHVPPEWYNRCMYSAGPTTVWQMGVVLFETLHRKASFETSKFLQNKMKISNKLSKDCQDFLQMCLTHVPEQRPTLKQLQLHPWLR
ncbi:serine/threonine-protein kinase pim-1-like [Mastacembelus armatus]|uniref:serine/threonine-protein kinase pim-1-like n=1 Tax=Mastacembelus armatus TaxID=205130 RepID=UPI000E463FA3|nr:serine/threonine-protein kinase pim-1-like [Mastacembelus armatus]